MGRGEWAGIRANGCVVWVGICGELWKAEPGMYVRASVCGGTWGSCVEVGVYVGVKGSVRVLGGEWVGDGQGESGTAWPLGSIQPEKENNKRDKKKKL